MQHVVAGWQRRLVVARVIDVGGAASGVNICF